MMVAPEAKLNDKQFDVISIGDLSKTEMITKSYRLFNGSHLTLEKVSSGKAARIKAGAVSDGVEVKVELDGEVVGQLPATFEVIPAGLNLRCPK